MKKFFGTIFWLLVLTAVCVGAYLTVNIIEKNEFAVEIDKKNKVVKKSYDSGFKVIYRAVDVRNVEVLRYPKTGVKTVNVKTYLPELADLNDDSYAINAGFEISYKILPDNFIVEYDMLAKDLVQEKLNNMAASELSRTVNSNFSSGYDAVKIENFTRELATDSIKNIMAAADNYGIEITNIKQSGNLSYPSAIVYNSGIVYKMQLNDLKKTQNIELENLKHTMSKLGIQDEYYFEKLKKMSVILKENPIMLKYIYIDKIAPNVKMILPVGMSGYPLDIENFSSGSSSKPGEIDNLK